LNSDDNSEYFFLFSPDTHNNISNSKLVSTLPHDTNLYSKALCGCITFTKGIQPVFTIVGSSNISPEITNKIQKHWSQRFKLGDQAREYKKQTKLLTIFEELQE